MADYKKPQGRPKKASKKQAVEVDPDWIARASPMMLRSKRRLGIPPATTRTLRPRGNLNKVQKSAPQELNAEQSRENRQRPPDIEPILPTSYVTNQPDGGQIIVHKSARVILERLDLEKHHYILEKSNDQVQEDPQPGPSNVQAVSNTLSIVDYAQPSTSGLNVSRSAWDVNKGNSYNNIASGMQPWEGIGSREDIETEGAPITDEDQKPTDEDIDCIPDIPDLYIWEDLFESFVGKPEIFSGPTPGCVNQYESIYDVFIDIWDEDIVGYIAMETNRYAKQTIEHLKANGTLNATSPLHRWRETDVEEIYILFAIFIYMGILNLDTQEEYWRKGCSDIFNLRKIMPYSRYITLLRFLHFTNNQYGYSNSILSPKLRKLEPVVNHLNSKFSTLYNLHSTVSLEESLNLLQGRLSWFQSISSEAPLFGIKSLELCEPQTGYMSRFEIYEEMNNNESESISDDPDNETIRMIFKLLKGLDYRGHCVTMINNYNTPVVARMLKTKGYDCLGKLSYRCHNVPGSVLNLSLSGLGTIVAHHCGDVSLVAWKSTHEVIMLSTCHDNSTTTERNSDYTITEPASIYAYNSTMRLVEEKNNIISSYIFERKRPLNWFTHIFKRLLNVSVHNAFIMYNDSLRSRDEPLMKHRDFRYKVADALFKIRRRRLYNREAMSRMYVAKRGYSLKVDRRHLPICNTAESRGRCELCYRRGGILNIIRTLCRGCRVFLCFETCWNVWHSSSLPKAQERLNRKRKQNQALSIS